MVKLIPIQVDLSGSGLGNKAVDGITISYSVDAIPSATANLHDVSPSGSGKTPTEQRRVLVAAEAEKMKAFQESAFRGQSDKVDITVNPFGHGFSGNILGPQRTVYSNYYQNGVQLIHDLEKANSYLPHIYSLQNLITRELDEFYNENYTNVFSMIKKLLEKRHKDFENTIRNVNFKDPTSKVNIEQIHENNLAVFPVIQQICDDSESKGGPTYLGFNDLPDEARRQLNSSMFNTLKSLMFNSQEQFIPILIQIGRTFQSFFVPPINGDSEYGYFKPNRFRTDEDTPISLEITGTVFASAKTDTRPLQQVIVSGQPVTQARGDDTNTENVYAFLGDTPTYKVYPQNPPKENGNNLPLSIPLWIPSHFYTSGIKNNVTQSRNLDLRQKISNNTRLANSVKFSIVNPISKVVDEFAETAYKTTALASYTVSVNSTLDFSIIPGKRYEVKDEEGDVLFSGFLQSVNHNISGIFSSLAASTTLLFNTVKFTNFELPT